MNHFECEHSSAVDTDVYCRRFMRPFVCPSIRSDRPSTYSEQRHSSKPLEISLSAWNLVGWCTTPWNRWLCRMDIPANYCLPHGILKFLMACTRWERQFYQAKDFRYQSEICWVDTLSHETDNNKKYHAWLNFAFSDVGKPGALSSPEYLVYISIFLENGIWICYLVHECNCESSFWNLT